MTNETYLLMYHKYDQTWDQYLLNLWNQFVFSNQIP
jgi:hypothetical protein